MDTPASSPVLSVRDLSVSFFAHPVLRGVNLAVPAGGIAVLVGRSGSGKTTLLRAVDRLNDEVPGCRTEGSVELVTKRGRLDVFPGTGPHAVPLPELRRRVGMVFQTPQVFPVSVFSNVAMPLAVALGCPRSELDDRVRDALVRADLWNEVKDRLAMSAERLSGGQQQRLCLARALALEPDVLLLDEPTASLDVHAARRVEELLLGIAGRMPVIMVSHGLSQSLRLASFLAVMEEGRVLCTVNDTSGMTEGDLERLLDGVDRPRDAQVRSGKTA
ncbi:phosphate ABC transporter ATP-binding protein [uncultured Mailhella sp.]|uniref:phosphate ABC transporter ATP-binding protein n=1 Tax=uncultured Mailhella sp. TaxID=1981031 RepID=UPI0025FF93AC|nr:phosphate ABC transporter ATP-binding protein [uncultured Mailhella sp.]